MRRFNSTCSIHESIMCSSLQLRRYLPTQDHDIITAECAPLCCLANHSIRAFFLDWCDCSFQQRYTHNGQTGWQESKQERCFGSIEAFVNLILIVSSQFNRGGRSGGGGGGGDGRSRSNWQDITRHNAKLERYYNEPGIIPDDERELFWEYMRRDLPNSFRFTGSRGSVLRFSRC